MSPAAGGPAIAISATFTAEPIADALTFWIRELGLDWPIVFAPYNQVFQSLLSPTSALSINAGGFNVVLIRWQDLGASVTFDSNVEELISSFKTAAARGHRTLAVVCPATGESEDVDRSQHIQARFVNELNGLPSISVVTPERYEHWYGIAKTHDPAAEKLANVPYSSLGFAGLATLIARRIDAWLRPPHKVIALDCDNTLWRGVVGEDGPQGIAMSPEFTALQRSMVDQADSGMLLAVCSKNNDEDVAEVFRTREDMVLRPNHIVASRVNWSPKSSNLREIAGELGLGVDSFILLDDSPAECAEVQANCPEVLTCQLPEEASDIPEFLNHLWVLDHWEVTSADRNRTAAYVQNAERVRVQKHATNLSDFIAGLQLQVRIERVRNDQLDRVAQLTQRTNQFNCTTIRRTSSEIEAFIRSGGECITVDATDRFGSYGLIGAALYRANEKAIDVDSFMLSCRALGRGIEHQVIQYLGKIAADTGAAAVLIRFNPTSRNDPARLFLESVGAQYRRKGEEGEGLIYELPASYACTVSYRPDADIGPVDDEPRSKQAGADTPRVRDYTRFATALRRPADVVEAVRAAHAPSEGLRVGNDFGYQGEEERVIAGVWADVLGYEAVGRDVNFFEVGGDSLRAVEVISRTIRALANESLTMSTLIEAPTVAEYSRLASLGGSHEYRCLVPMREGRGRRPPFFCINGAGGNVLSLRTLAMKMPDDLPFYCLQTRGLDGLSEPFSSVEETASYYLAEIRRIQPHGPYYLGGGCYGGLVAFEIAQQILKRGEQVGVLAMIDTYNNAYGSLLPKHRVFYSHARFLAKRSIHHFRQLASVKSSDRAAYLAGRFRTLIRRLSTVIGVLSKTTRTELAVSGPEGVPITENNRFHLALNRVLNANLAAQAAYLPKAYPGRIVLFRASERAIEPYEDRYLGWGPVAAGGVEDYEINANHTFITDSAELARSLDSCLRREPAPHAATRSIGGSPSGQEPAAALRD
jgi:FkbH-like protein